MSTPALEQTGVPVPTAAERRAAPARRSRLRRRIRTAGLVLGALVPQFLKRVVYRWCFGYRIAPGASVGLAFLDCERLVVEEGARIAHGVAFLGCGDVRVGKHVHLGSLNLFAGGDRIELDDYSQVRRLNFINAIREHDATNDPDSSFYLGWGAVVTAEHRIDFTDRVHIGRSSILAGRGTSLWTHNIRTGKPVLIGDYCYIGSECRFSPGASVADCSVVGLGSVVTRALSQPWSLYAGVPAERKRQLGPDDEALLFGPNRKDMPSDAGPPRPWDSAPHAEPPPK